MNRTLFNLTYTNYYNIFYFYGIQIYFHQYFRKIFCLDILMKYLLILYSVCLHGKIVSAICQQLKQHCILAFVHFVFSRFDRTSSWFLTLLSTKSKEVMFSRQENNSVYELAILTLPTFWVCDVHICSHEVRS